MNYSIFLIYISIPFSFLLNTTTCSSYIYNNINIYSQYHSDLFIILYFIYIIIQYITTTTIGIRLSSYNIFLLFFLCWRFQSNDSVQTKEMRRGRVQISIFNDNNRSQQIIRWTREFFFNAFFL